MKENLHLCSLLSVQGAESLRSEPTKYLKFLDLPQNGSLDPKQILDSQSE